jgi:hypothetical protein
MIDRIASLEVLVPFSARLPRRALPVAATRTGDPASTVDRLRATSFALMPRGIITHTMAASGLSLRFCADEVGSIDSARIDAARFDRDAPP